MKSSLFDSRKWRGFKIMALSFLVFAIGFVIGLAGLESFGNLMAWLGFLGCWVGFIVGVAETWSG